MNAWRRRNREAVDDDAATAYVRPAFRARVRQPSPDPAPERVGVVASPERAPKQVQGHQCHPSHNVHPQVYR